MAGPSDVDEDSHGSRRVAAAGTILAPPRNCWRVERASRATPLVDAEAYFAMLADALERAQRQILILAWDVHALLRLTPDAPTRRGRRNLRERLAAVARHRPDLEIRILLWDFTVLYASDRLPFPKAMLDWSMPANVRLVLDDRMPVGAAQHQKIVVIDDALAFIGGIDLTEGRWDTSAHAADDDRRTTARGVRYPPFHDAQLAVDGAVAAALGELARDRWTACTGEALAAPEPGVDPWPDAIGPYWRDVTVGLARTRPAYGDGAAVDEILNLYLDAIAAAEHCIYIENQFLTAERVCQALIDRLVEPQGPEVVLVTQWGTHSWLEANTMGLRRRRFVTRLRAGDTHGRLRVVAPRVPGVALDDYELHSKLLVVDDRHVQIGSANLNNRSMGLDVECDAAVQCVTRAERALALEFRNSLLAEHLGLDVERVGSTIAEVGSVTGAIDALAGDGRSLIDLEVGAAQDADSRDALAELADLERPLEPGDLLDRLSPDWDLKTRRRTLRAGLRIGVIVLAIVAATLLWRATGLRDLVAPEQVAELLDRAPGGFVGALLAFAAFIVGGFVVFPVTVLIFASALAFGPWLGFAYSLVGTFASAAATYGVGQLLGRRAYRRFARGTVAKVGRQLARRGVLAIAVLRIVPVAPFTVINVLAGASDIKFRDYALGTVLGMGPGIVLLTAMGGQLASVLRDPTPGQIALFALLGMAWIGAGLGLQALTQRLERRRSRASSA